MVIAWLSRVLVRYSWTSRTIGRGRRRVTQRKWVSWPNIDWLLTAKLRLEQLEDRAVSAVFTVTTVGTNGLGSLRQAILDANATAGADSILFNIPGAGVHTLQPAVSLPNLASDATSQLGYAGTPLIELDGTVASAAGGGASGFHIRGSGVTVRGFAINRFDIAAFYVDLSSSVTIVGNYLGVLPDGTTAAGNGVGVFFGDVQGSVIGGTTASDRNLISGNDAGIRLYYPTTTGNTVSGNYIGTDVTGTVAVANTLFGVQLDTGAHDNLIGGTTTGARNLISGNAGN